MGWLVPWLGLGAEGYREDMRGEREGQRRKKVPWWGVEPEPRWHQVASFVVLQFQRLRVSLNQGTTTPQLDRGFTADLLTQGAHQLFPA